MTPNATPAGRYAPLVDLFAAALAAQGFAPDEAREAAANLVASIPEVAAGVIERRRPDLHRYAPWRVVEHVSAAIGAQAATPAERTHLPELLGVEGWR